MNTLRRRLWQFRLTSLISVTVAVGLVMYLNMFCDIDWELHVRVPTYRLEIDKNGSHIHDNVTEEYDAVRYYRCCYGFPLTAYKRFVSPNLRHYSAFLIRASVKTEFDAAPALLNCITALLIVYLAFRTSEWLTHGRKKGIKRPPLQLDNG
jgi:hypothetical protein